MKNIFIFLGIMFIFPSCFKNLFKIKSTHTWEYEKLKQADESKKTIVVHFSNDLKKLKRPVFDSGTISGYLDSYQSLKVKSSKYTYAEPDLQTNLHQYKHKHKQQLFSELHLFINEEYKGQQMIIINKDNFLQLREYSTSWGETVLSYTGGVLTLSALAFVTFIIVGAAGGLTF